MKPKAFFVSLNEVRQNFVFGDRFVDFYTGTVTLSDGSTRTIKLTPMVHEKFGEVVKLEDNGHVSYMGVHGSSTTNGKLMVQLHSRELLYGDEQSCGAAILDTEPVQNLYRRLGTEPEVIKTRLAHLPSSDRNANLDHIFAAESVAQHTSDRLDAPREIRLLVGLLMYGRAQIKTALTPCAGSPGDIPFFVARGRPEAELRLLWPAPAEQTGNAVLLDDPFTSRRLAADALHESLGMDPQLAADKVCAIDQSGSCVLELSPGTDVTDTCSRINAQWRQKGLALYCAPQSLASTSAVS